jgi:glutathione S-transferase
MMEADLAALSGILGDGPYLLGRQPCYADAMLFGLLDTGLWWVAGCGGAAGLWARPLWGPLWGPLCICGWMDPQRHPRSHI